MLKIVSDEAIIRAYNEGRKKSLQAYANEITRHLLFPNGTATNLLLRAKLNVINKLLKAI